MGKPDPNLPRGVQAFLFEKAERRRRAEEAVVRVLQAAGLKEVLLPVLDYAAPYEGVTAEGDERLYRFMDREGALLSLRADFTPLSARVVAPRLPAGGRPVELFYRGDVVRDEESGVGRPREFAQVGAERYGDPAFEADERMLSLLLSALSEIPGSRLTLTLGYAGLLEKLMAASAPELTRQDGEGLAPVLLAARERRMMRVEATLRAAGAVPAAAEEISRGLVWGFDMDSALFRLPVLAAGAAALERGLHLAREARPGIGLVVDLAGTPTAPYYTGLTFGVDARGVSAPLAGGGRYDGLLSRFGSPAPAVGFSIGVEALTAALEIGEEAATATTVGEVGAPRAVRIAVGKGRLLGKAVESLRSAGIEFPEMDGRRLLVPDSKGAFELLLLKDDDVPIYVAHGGADLGIVGSDRVAESGESVFSPVDFQFGICRVSLIGRTGKPFQPDGHPVRVGTKYRRLAKRYFDGRRIAHDIVPLAGSVELAAALGLTDVVVDLIETGATIAAHGLTEIETISESQATLIVGRAALTSRRAEIAPLVERLARGGKASC